MTINRENRGIAEIIDEFILRGNGNSKTISKSKTKKIILNKKKCRENGVRAFLKVSNPHSNLVMEFRCWLDFIETMKLTVIKIRQSIIKIKRKLILVNINVGG